jgi:hypothetical protein
MIPAYSIGFKSGLLPACLLNIINSEEPNFEKLYL